MPHFSSFLCSAIRLFTCAQIRLLTVFSASLAVLQTDCRAAQLTFAQNKWRNRLNGLITINQNYVHNVNIPRKLSCRRKIAVRLKVACSFAQFIEEIHQCKSTTAYQHFALFRCQSHKSAINLIKESIFNLSIFLCTDFRLNFKLIPIIIILGKI